MVVSNHQHQFSLNVRVGIIGDHLVRQVICSQCRTGEAYLHFLQVTLPSLLYLWWYKGLRVCYMMVISPLLHNCVKEF
ncbi:hypothetical protein PR048_005445 [Dryococelus australis]|uniref:Uncharacterized protein n=1 Tax=Dryococelus australis TaxID=614101 RepID=A0ABQ9I876_9NEOP|nr:hypothetical protein PR048_005445 [Dryococelus australis]